MTELSPASAGVAGCATNVGTQYLHATIKHNQWSYCFVKPPKHNRADLLPPAHRDGALVVAEHHAVFAPLAGQVTEEVLWAWSWM